MSRPYREIGKPLAMRTLELVRALQLIRDSLNSVRAGQAYHLIALSGQLRAVLTDRSRNATPLLLELAATLGQKLSAFCMPDVNDPSFPNEIRNALAFHVSGFPVTPHRQFAAQRELTYLELLDLEIIFFKDKKFTVRTIIDWFANLTGGAHYSKQIPEDFAQLLSIHLGGLHPIPNVLIQLGEAVLTGGRKLLKSVVDLEVHALLAVPRESEDLAETNHLIDARYDSTPMRLSLVLNKRMMPVFVVAGLQGIVARVESDRLIDWSYVRHIRASASISDDLSTYLELAIDGERVGRASNKEPLFVLSDPLDYEVYHNRQVDGPPQKFSFGVAAIGMFGAELSPLDHAYMMVDFDQRRADNDLRIMFYTPYSFGYAPQGTKNLLMSGSVKRCKASEVLSCQGELNPTP